MRDIVTAAFERPGIGPDPEAPRNLWPAPEPEPGGTALKSAAVLVPLVDRSEGMSVLLTRRTETLPSHPGQISFPGGRIAPADANPEDTALRETVEEIGLSRGHIELVGRMDAHDTGTGYRVVPVVGLVRPPFPVVPDPSEVAEVFEVPMDFVLDPANHRQETRIHRGRARRFFVLPFEDRYIWGLTARILVDLSRMLRC